MIRPSTGKKSESMDVDPLPTERKIKIDDEHAVVSQKVITSGHIDAAFEAVRRGGLAIVNGEVKRDLKRIMLEEFKVKLTEDNGEKIWKVMQAFSNAMAMEFTRKAIEILSLPDGMKLTVQATT